MDREVPDNVDVVLEETEIDAHRVVVIDVAQLSGDDDLAHLAHRGRVNERVVHQQHEVSRRGFVHQPACLI